MFEKCCKPLGHLAHPEVSRSVSAASYIAGYRPRISGLYCPPLPGRRTGYLGRRHAGRWRAALPPDFRRDMRNALPRRYVRQRPTGVKCSKGVAKPANDLDVSNPLPCHLSQTTRRGNNEIPARVVVIGGGIAGCSTLYHLTREGWSDVVLVERDELTSGTTWHSAAQVTEFRHDPDDGRAQKPLHRALQGTGRRSRLSRSTTTTATAAFGWPTPRRRWTAIAISPRWRAAWVSNSR